MTISAVTVTLSDGVPDQVLACRMVQVHCHRHRRRAGDRQHGLPDRRERAVVGDAILTDLQDDRRSRRLRASDDGLRVLDPDDVERQHATARCACRTDDLDKGNEGHQDCPRSVTRTLSSAQT